MFVKNQNVPTGAPRKNFVSNSSRRPNVVRTVNNGQLAKPIVTTTAAKPMARTKNVNPNQKFTPNFKCQPLALV